MNQQHQATPTTRPVVIQVSGASDTSRKNDNQSSNQPQYVTLSTTGGQEVIISGNEGIEGGHQILTSGQIVQGATVQEVQVMEGGQEVTYAYTTSDNDTVTVIRDPSGSGQDFQLEPTSTSHSQAQQIFHVASNSSTAGQTSSAFTPAIPKDENVDDSYKYYDNIRGKINNGVLSELVEKYDAENSAHSKNDRLHQWGLAAQDYCTITGQNKSRTMLMKKWSSAKYYREHEGRPVEMGGRVKGCFKREKRETSAETPTKAGGGHLNDGISDWSQTKPQFNKKDKAAMFAKHIKQYDALKLEAARLERDAQRISVENAEIEGEKLRKEAAILDIELDTVRLDLAIKKEEASKMGIIIQDAEEDDKVETDRNPLEDPESEVQKNSAQSSILLLAGEAETTLEVLNVAEEKSPAPLAKRTRR